MNNNMAHVTGAAAGIGAARHLTPRKILLSPIKGAFR